MIIVLLVVDLAVAFWIYTDAEAEDNNGVAWAILSVFFPGISLLVYALFSKSPTAWQILGGIATACAIYLALHPGLFGQQSGPIPGPVPPTGNWPPMMGGNAPPGGQRAGAPYATRGATVPSVPPGANRLPTGPMPGGPPTIPGANGGPVAPGANGAPIAPTASGPPTIPTGGGPAGAQRMGGPPTIPTANGPRVYQRTGGPPTVPTAIGPPVPNGAPIQRLSGPPTVPTATRQ